MPKGVLSVRRNPLPWTAIIAASVLSLDAMTKVLAVFLASHGYGRGVLLLLRNPEFSLGLASASFPLMLTLSTLGIFVFGGLSLWHAQQGTAPRWVPGLLIGGAVANLLDRLLFGAVHDWLCLANIVINLADVAVMLGLIGYFISLWQTRASGPPRTT
jgi:lipoprotein signal peptidase